eukprot:GDKH01010796.1.p1 GENE.GDKH01010796.1~~GDKH01010796.1.p1  ORF type:complete len:66 (-),score=3.10 GDKH01010796.1:11-208(-)
MFVCLPGVLFFLGFLIIGVVGVRGSIFDYFCFLAFAFLLLLLFYSSLTFFVSFSLFFSFFFYSVQ